MHEGQLFVVSGPAGVGKGTICRMVIEERIGVNLSISMTTRPIRKGDVAGESYYFVSKEEFEEKIKAGGFLEYAQVYGNYYGTPKQKVLDTLEKGVDVILEIDVQGAAQVKKQYPEGAFIFILPPSMKELRKRLEGRGSETEEGINVRMGNAISEIACIGDYDYYIVNAARAQSLARIKEIIMAERSRVTQRTVGFIQKYKEEI